MTIKSVALDSIFMGGNLPLLRVKTGKRMADTRLDSQTPATDYGYQYINRKTTCKALFRLEPAPECKRRCERIPLIPSKPCVSEPPISNAANDAQ